MKIMEKRMPSLFPVLVGILVLVGLIAGAASAAEYPVGEARNIDGMEVKAVYLQPIEMDPPGMMLGPEASDIHLEADIHALAHNPHGFPEGAWIPYLEVQYLLTKIDTGEQRNGVLMAMVASDGPHYGDNVNLMGMGLYRLEITISPASANSHSAFGRHTDKETGVAPWFEPITTVFEFAFAGTGKRGSY